MQERDEANALFKSKQGKELQKEITKKARTFVPGAGLPDLQRPAGPTKEERWKIREAIGKATSLEEIERLNRLLQAGQIPGRPKAGEAPGAGQGQWRWRAIGRGGVCLVIGGVVGPRGVC